MSRRAFVAGSAQTLAAWQLARSRWLPRLEQAVPAGIPTMVVEDFSKPFDPAYLSNGLIGIRPGPNPLATAQAQVGGFVMKDETYLMERLAPAPYPLALDIRAGGASALEHPELLATRRQALDMAAGELVTAMVYAPRRDVTMRVEVLQFASRSVPSLVCQEIRITPSADTELTLVPSIDTRAFPGSAYLTRPPGVTQADLAGGFASPGGTSKLGVAVWIVTPDGPAERREPATTTGGLQRAYVTRATGGRPLRVQCIAAMVSDTYHPEPELEAIRLASWGGMLGFDELRAQNRAAWKELWQSRVRIVGDPQDQRLLDAAFFYLHSSVHASTRTGMGPYGLSQHRYYSGHSFWDTETWSFLPIVLAAPATARALLEFRLRGLEAARRRAALFGYRGAQFPWEAAQTGGFEATPTCCDTGWVEQHSTPDVALAFWEYQLATNDRAFLREGTWPVLQAVAEWIESRGVFTVRGFEIRHIEGPDEGTPNVDNSAYMNLVCKMVLAAAVRCARLVGVVAPRVWVRIRDTLVLPRDESGNFVLPYDRPPSPADIHYSTGDMDFLTVHDAPVDRALLRNTHDRERSLTADASAHVGFATSALAATAAFLGEREQAKRLFERSWRDVWLEPFGMIRERPSQDYGCFLTTFGSLLQTALLGFTGLRVSEGDWAKYPAVLPAGWRSIEVDRLWVRGEPRRLVARDGMPAEFF